MISMRSGVSENDIQDILNGLDANGDGVMDFDEFVQAALRAGFNPDVEIARRKEEPRPR